MIRGGNIRQGRAAALLILLVLVLALWLGPVAAYRHLVDSQAQEIGRQEQLLRRYRSLAQIDPADGRQPALIAPALLFPAVPEGQAVALMQETVKRAAAANQVQIHSLQVLRSETLPAAVKIGVRVRAAGDIAGLGRLLYAIEAARPVLYPDNLQIQAHPAVPGGTSSGLDFQFDVSGVTPGAPS